MHQSVTGRLRCILHVSYVTTSKEKRLYYGRNRHETNKNTLTDTQTHVKYSSQLRINCCEPALAFCHSPSLRNPTFINERQREKTQTQETMT